MKQAKLREQPPSKNFDLRLLIDVGNTRTKFALVASDGKIIAADAFATDRLNKADDPAENYPRKEDLPHVFFAADARKIPVYFASVVPSANTPLREFLSAQGYAAITEITSEYHGLPRIDLTEPRAVGIDLQLAAYAARKLLAKQNEADADCVVVQAGTAIAISFTMAGGETGVFRGGVIMPGIASLIGAFGSAALLPKLSVSALAETADELRRSDFAADKIINCNTESALLNGVSLMIKGGIELLLAKIDDAQTDNTEREKSGRSRSTPKVFITGGDGEFVAKMIPRAEFFPDLVLHGLVEITRSISPDS